MFHVKRDAAASCRSRLVIMTPITHHSIEEQPGIRYVRFVVNALGGSVSGPTWWPLEARMFHVKH
jgi:hypothetical protein